MHRDVERRSRGRTAPVTRVLRSLDPRMPVTNVRTLESLVEGTISRPRFNATMLTLFAALGLLLASIGICGVLSTRSRNARKRWYP